MITYIHSATLLVEDQDAALDFYVGKLDWEKRADAAYGDGGIHRVSNPGEGAAISVHLYGPRMGEVDGRDYDPSRDYVCDRRY